MNTELRNDIAELLKETGRAHHEAFAATDGADPDWPIWYADYARDKFADRYGLDFTRSQLVFCLMSADLEHRARAPESDWPAFYANEIVEHCAPSESPAEDKLALYYMDGCPFCNIVRAEIDELGIDVELRSIIDELQYRNDLIEVRGRATVPVLRITSPGGEDRWMPESQDIIRYLRKTYA